MTPEVRAFEYALGIYSVLIGLAVADIAASFHRLLRHRSRVTWDPLTLLAAGYALCMAVYMWFDIWGVRQLAVTRQFFFYLGLVGQLFLLFLVAAASLPDEADDQTNLRDYYAGNSRSFWLLVTLFQLVYFAFGVYFTGVSLGLTPLLAAWAKMGAPLAVSLVLLAWQSRTLHYLGLAALYLAMAVHYGAYRIN